MPSSLPLESVNVLDLSRDVAGAYCTKLLADLGATVLMVEPPGGHPARGEGPFPGGVPHAEKSGLFIYLASNKRSVAIDRGDSRRAATASPRLPRTPTSSSRAWHRAGSMPSAWVTTGLAPDTTTS